MCQPDSSVVLPSTPTANQDPQAAGHLRRGSATIDGSVAAISKTRKIKHFARTGHDAYDESKFSNVYLLGVECFGRISECGQELPLD